MPKGMYVRSKAQLEKLKKYGIQKGQKLQEKVRRKMSAGHIGSKNGNWRGGKSKRADGYTFIYNPKHPSSSKRGYILEHRLVMEKHLGRLLRQEEVVHHVNKNPSDNRIENLLIFSNASEHKSHHNQVDGHWQTHRKMGVS